MDKASLIRLYAPGNNIPHYKTSCKDDKALAGKDITYDYSAQCNKGCAYVPLHSGTLTNNKRPVYPKVPKHIAIHTGKPGGINIAYDSSSRTYDAVYRKIFHPKRSHDAFDG